MKTISVYDAVKLATKGQRVVKKVPTCIGHCYKVGTQEQVDHSHGGACLYDDSTSLKYEKHGEQGVTATLLAHFFNHGPALLAMLEEFVKLYEPFRKQLDANEAEILDEAIALIAKASKVEIEE